MKLSRIDHIHLYVENIGQAEQWYKEVLGFTRDDSLYFWFEQGGPLVIKNHDAALSLFIRNGHQPGHTMAFNAPATIFSELLPLLKQREIPFTVIAHQISMSVYLSDPSDNKIEITSYEYEASKAVLRGEGGWENESLK